VKISRDTGKTAAALQTKGLTSAGWQSLTQHQPPHPSDMTTSALVAVLVLLLIPVILLWRLTETRQQTIHRLRRQGQTWQQIGARYGVHRTTAYRWSLA